MASSTRVPPPSSPNAPAVGSGDFQQQEVMPSRNSGSLGNATPMNPLLLASACLGSSAALKFLFDREDKKEPPMMFSTQVFLDKLAGYTPRSSTDRTLTMPQASDDLEVGDDQPAAALPAAVPGRVEAGTDQPAALTEAAPGIAEAEAEDGIHKLLSLPLTAPHVVEDGVDRHVLPAAARLLEGVSPEGDTALHVVARHGDSTGFLDCASIINTRDEDLLFVVNRKGDSPLHFAARSGNSQTLSRLIELAGSLNRMHELLRKENVHNETALHEAIRIGSMGIVKRLLEADPLLANYPEQGTSPLYLAISLEYNEIAKTIHGMSNGNLSYSGPNGQNVLHAATARSNAITEHVLKWNFSLTTHGDMDGSTPLHFAAASPNNSIGFHQLFEANPAPVYQADNYGLFPIHVAASLGAIVTIRNILQKYPSNAGLCTAQGRTFLHVAVQNKRLNIVLLVCRTPSLAWILNTRDHDGNTALHLAVQAGKFRSFCSLYGNKEVHLSLENNSKQTPSDLARNMIPQGLHYDTNNEKCIYWALTCGGANHSCRRVDKFERVNTYMFELKPEDTTKEEEKVKDTSQLLGIGSVLITTVAFGATFALPGGYIADDHRNGGTPTRAGTYTFDAFVVANTLAFICSSIATIGLIFSGTNMVNLKIRQINLAVSMFFMSSSVTSLAAAFALGVYLVLAPVAHGTAILVCVLSPLVVLYKILELLIKGVLLARPLCLRMGLIPGLTMLARAIVQIMFMEFWPFILIFGWAAIARSYRNHQ